MLGRDLPGLVRELPRWVGENSREPLLASKAQELFCGGHAGPVPDSLEEIRMLDYTLYLFCSQSLFCLFPIVFIAVFAVLRPVNWHPSP
jgi:hypothetical protein